MSSRRSAFTCRGRAPVMAGPVRLRSIGTEVKAELTPQSQLVFWRRLWDIIIGSEKEESQKWEIILFACLFYYSFVMVLCRLLRRVSRTHLPSELTPYLLDFVTTFQVCACSLENGFIDKAYGRSYLMLTIAITSMWCFLTLGKSSGNPCANLARFLARQISLRQFLFRASFQLTAALLAFKFARFWWSLGATSQHTLRASLISCASDLRVSVLAGFLIEMAATTTDSLFGLLIFGQSFLKHERFQQLCCVLLGVTMTASGIHLTGMYTNPANATAQTFGCNGSHALEHITVYWLGPFSGTYLAHRIHTYFEFFSIREKIFETPLVAAVDPRPILKVVEQLPEEHVTEIVA